MALLAAYIAEDQIKLGKAGACEAVAASLVAFGKSSKDVAYSVGLRFISLSIGKLLDDCTTDPVVLRKGMFGDLQP